VAWSPDGQRLLVVTGTRTLSIYSPLSDQITALNVQLPPDLTVLQPNWADVEAGTAGLPTLAPPATATPTATPTPDCEAQYQELITEIGRDYTSCRIALRPFTDVCPHPEFLQAGNYALNIELILDASGSMAGAVGGQSKLSIAQQTLTDFIDRLPGKGANVALRVYGHKGSNKKSDREVSCQGTELIYPFQPLDKETFKQTIRSFSPTGWTPIARSLRAALDDFQDVQDDAATNVVVLVSDGIETCGGDPVAAAKLLQESELETVVHVIGFDVDAEAARQLKAVAQAGGGEYFEARTAQEFQQVFIDFFNLKEWTAFIQCALEQLEGYELESASKIAAADACYLEKTAAEQFDFFTQSVEDGGVCSDYLNQRFELRTERIDREAQQVEQWSEFFQEEVRKIEAIYEALKASELERTP